MMNHHYRLLCRRHPWTNQIDFLMGEFDSAGNRISYAKHIEMFTPEKPDDPITGDGSFQLNEEETQILMDNLWSIGIRPTEVGTGGQLESVKYHLEDMRKLVFKVSECLKT